jgi:hypothetical protein
MSSMTLKGSKTFMGDDYYIDGRVTMGTDSFLISISQGISCSCCYYLFLFFLFFPINYIITN